MTKGISWSAVLDAQRTEKGKQFAAWRDEVKNLLDGKDEESQRKAVLANQSFCRGVGLPTSSGSDIGHIETRGVGAAAVHVDALMSNFSKMYTNDEYIGERLMPIVPVSKRSDKFLVYPKRERFAFPDDALSERAESNEISESRSTDNYSVKDYGLSNYLDLETLNNQDAPLNEMLDLVEAVLEGMAFKREGRIATIVQASANYSGNTAAAITKWDTASTGGSIVADILAAKDALWRGKNPTRLIGVTTLDNWNTCIVNNPALTDKYKYTNSGFYTPDLIAGWFGLDEILIGKARQDTANEGQTASYSRMWSSDFFAIVAVAQRPSLRSLHFGSTFRMKDSPYTTSWQDPAIGVRGGLKTRVSVSEDHKIVGGDSSFYISDVKT